LACSLAVAVAPPPATAAGGASLDLTKTVSSAKAVPTMAATLAVDRTTAIPGDQLTYTAHVTNTGAVMTLQGAYSAAEGTDSAGTLTDWYEEVEYHDVATKTWVSLGGYQAASTGWTPVSPSPSTTGLTVHTTPVATSGVTYPSTGDHLLGTVIGAGKKASWAYMAQLTLSAAQVGVLSDPKRSDRIRNVVHVEVTPRDPKNGQPYTYRVEFTNPFGGAGTPITGVSVNLTLPDGSTRTVDQSAVPALASIPNGGSVNVPTKWVVPTVAAPGTNEADAAYLSRLAAVEGTQLTAKATATGIGAGNTVTATADPVSTTEHLPILSVGKSGPATVDAGDTGHYQLPLQNTGGAAASGIALTDTVPDGGAGTVSGTPSTLAGGGSATPTAAFAVPDTQPDGPLTDTAQVRWTDANGNPYGPVSASFTTAVQSSLVGATLTLAPETAGPDVVGTDQALTATLLDRNGQPVPNIAVTLSVSGTNSVTGTVSTNSTGVANFHYTGSAAGLDTAQTKATAGTVRVQSNTAQIGWVSPIAPIGTTTLDGRFFTESTSATTFVAKPGDVPTFGQTFPNLAFNPSAAALPHNLTGVSPSTHPFTDVTTDLMGNGVGAIVAQGNGKQAGGTGMTSFDAVFTADFVVAKPGDVTFRFDYDAGFLFGVGGGASRVSGSYENPPASNVSPFEGYPLVGADNRPNNAVHTTTVTVHFPAAGSYPYEVDYTESGGPTLSLVLSTVSFAADDTSGLTAYAGYADGLRAGGSIFPFPWSGSPNTVFVGCTGSCSFDGGAVRLDNTTGHPVTVNSLTVDFGPSCRFAIWPHDRQLPDGQTAIFTQMISGADSGCPTNGSFDTSDAPFITCNPTHITPHITFTIDGQTHSFDDTDQILNTEGVDLASCPGGNESHAWSRIGGAGVGINTPLPPAGSVVLSPLSGGDAKITSVQANAGTAQSFRVDVLDASGLPVANAPVDLLVTGAHLQHVLGTTGADGTTVLSYNTSSAGDDSVQASTFISGMRTLSGVVAVHWSLPAGTVPDPANPGQTLPAPPPVITAPTPADGTRVTAPVPVQATVTPPAGETITSWTVSYQAASPGSPRVTLASGTGAPPATLATFDPTVLANDTYAVTVSATSSGGGVQTSSTTVAVAGSLKPGRYVTSYTDVDLPVNGLPMQVLRNYDSTNARLGDFGVGWQVSVGNFRISANRTLGAGGWTEYPTQCSFFGCQYAFKSSVPHTVTVTFPDQHQERFNFTPSGGFSVFYFLGAAAFTPVPGTGTTSTLEALSTDISYDFAGNIDNDLFGDLYSPTRFKLTTRDGKVFVLDTATGLVSETDPSGNSVSVDGSGVHASTGQSITFVKDGTGRITKITEPNGQEIDYGYSPAGDLTSVQYPDGVTESHSYDADHHLTGSAGGGKPSSTVQYDPSGRVSAITDGAGNHVVLDTDVAGRQQVVHDRNGLLTTVYTFDDLGDVLQKDQIVGGSARTTKFSYDPLGRVTDLIDPQQHHQHWVYDETDTAGNGNLLSYTDANDRTTRYTGYDAHGHASTVIGPDGAPIGTFDYDPTTGLLLSSQRPGSPPSVFSYYPNGRMKTSVDPAGRTVNYTYNSAGYRTSVSDAAGRTTSYLPDANGRDTSVTDGSNNTTHYTYDGAGNVASVTDPSGVTRTFHYNDRGLLDQAGDGTGVTAYVYNDAGLVSQRTDRNGAVTSYEYDATGKLTKETRPGNDVTSYRYDALERLVEADNASAEVTFSYDDAGNVMRQVSCAPQAAHAACTDASDASQQPMAGFDYGWSQDGQQASVTGPGGATSYHYDGNGRLSQVVDPAGQSATYHFDGQNRLSSTDSANGITDTFSYDPSSLLTGRDASSGTTAVSQSDYTIDPVTAQRTSTTDLDGTSTYTYQNNGWLTQATHPAASGLSQENYSYDGAGNVTSTADVPAAQTGYVAGRLTQFGGTTLGYDAEGNLTSKTDTATSAVTRYHWNVDHELTSVDLPDGSTVRYSYDPLHRRVQSVHGTQVTRYAWDAFNLAAVYDGGNHLIASYVTLPTGADATDVAAPAEVLERHDAHGTSYFVHDGTDSTTALTDAAGTVTSRYRYNAAGLPASTNGSETGYTWIGAQYDAATGLYYLADRYYDPTLGRFIAEDPAAARYYNAPLGRWTHGMPAPAVGHPVSFNRYAYAGDDPINSTDPSGDGLKSVFATIGCAIALASGTGITQGTPFEEPVQNIVDCLEQYVDDKKELEEAEELAEAMAEADEQPVAELVLGDIVEEIDVVIEISIEITIAEEF
jgi:uncharacterized repeat protein (TIGR01451 family)